MLLLWILGSPLDKFSTFGFLGDFGKIWAEGGGSVASACQAWRTVATEPWKALRAAFFWPD
jgi:hypothetical protein